jgi:hypothetical protein
MYHATLAVVIPHGAVHHTGVHHHAPVPPAPDQGAVFGWYIVAAFLVCIGAAAMTRRPNETIAADVPIPQPSENGIVPIAGEKWVGAWRAKIGTTVKSKHYVSGNQALYLPLGHGFRARVGGSRGHSVTDYKFVWSSPGVAYLSNFRIVFKGSAQFLSIPYADILTYDQYIDGLGVNAPKAGTITVLTGNAELAKAFNTHVQNLVTQAS